MADDEPQIRSAQRAQLRFEATVHPGEAPGVAMAHVADLDLDRLPDADGEVRVIVDPVECTRLLEEGFEVRLHRSVPVRPLDRDLIADDEGVRAWLEERIGPAGPSEAT